MHRSRKDFLPSWYFSDIDTACIECRISHEVGEMADAIEHTQMLASRASMIQKCGHEHNAAMSVCDPALVKRYSTRLRMNYDTFKMIHQSLYLVRPLLLGPLLLAVKAVVTSVCVDEACSCI